MLTDWFTVVAQAVNFLILVWLLKRFLYKPILHAIDEREKRIAAQLEEAEAKKSEAQQERDAFERKNEELARQRESLMSRAEEEAKAERELLLNEARNQAETLRARLQEAARQEQDSLSHEIASRLQREAFAIARKTLSDLAAASLEERMAEVFIRRLRELNGEEKRKLASLLHESRHAALVRSAFDLPPAQREAIQRAMRETLGSEAPIQFETSPALVGGIELAANGHKLAWSIADYLVSLEKNAGEVLESKNATGR